MDRQVNFLMFQAFFNLEGPIWVFVTSLTVNLESNNCSVRFTFEPADNPNTSHSVGLIVNKKAQKAQTFQDMLKNFLNEKLTKLSKHPKFLCWDKWVRLFLNICLIFFLFSKKQYSSDVTQKIVYC